MKVVFPMAGRGSRFAQKGVETPKPLIQALGQPMFAWALKSLEHVDYRKIIFVALAAHDREFGLRDLLKKYVTKPFDLRLLDEVTEGQLCTVLAAGPELDEDEDVLVTSSDTYVVSTIGEDIRRRRADTHGLISTATLPGDRWSFARCAEDGRVVEVAEKVRISDHASTGLYYFSSGRELVQIANEMIAARETTRGEYFVIPAYQKMIQRGWRVEISQASAVWDMGVPEALREFEQLYQKPVRQ